MSTEQHQVTPDPVLAARAKEERTEYAAGTVRPFVLELASRGKVRAEEWAVGMNNYERDVLTPVLEPEVFVQHLAHCLQNCEPRYAESYDGALVTKLGPEAARRLRVLDRRVQSLEGLNVRWARDMTLLQGRLVKSRTEMARLTRTLGAVVEWCTDVETGKSLFKTADTFVEGLRRAKTRVMDMILGRLEPGGKQPEALPAFNSFGVTARDEQVLVLMPPFPTLTREDALRLAAWLIVGAKLAGEEQAIDVVVATVEKIHG